MNVRFQFDDVKTALVIVGTILFFYTYYYLAHSRVIERFFKRIAPGDASDINLFLFRKFAGFFLLGVVPGIIYFWLMEASGEKFGITISHLASSYILIAVLILFTAIVLFFHHRRNPERSTLQFNMEEWNLSMFMLNVLGWSFYLVAYEFLFRGILLFECYDAMGFWPAVAINVSLYSAIHMVNGRDQALGALIFGTVACYFALIRETLLIPVFMHLSLSILSDFYSIRKRQSLKIISGNQLNSQNK